VLTPKGVNKLATPLGTKDQVSQAVLSIPSLFDLLLSFAIVVEFGLLGPIASIILTLHQAAQAVCVVLCLACYHILKTRREARLWSLIA
jgi:hypothetical protein